MNSEEIARIAKVSRSTVSRVINNYKNVPPRQENFLKLMEDCMSGMIDIVMTKSISRFSRNLVDTLQYVRMLKERGVTIIFEKRISILLPWRVRCSWHRMRWNRYLRM